MKFDNYFISADIKQSLLEMGFNKTTDIQFKTIPHILNGEDVLAIAQTGTGKTAAYAIPVIEKLIQSRKHDKQAIRCIVMVPTRELAIQINDVFRALTKYTKIESFPLFGGTGEENQIAKLNKGLDILITTPGRMFDLASRKYIDMNAVEILVLDEADLMLDLGFINDIRDLIKYLPRNRQTLFISATINPEIKKLAYSLVRNAIRIQLSPDDPVSKNIEHFVVKIEMDHKRFFLERLIKENPESKILIFVRTKVRAERIAAALARVDIESQTIHSGKDQKDRNATLSGFKLGESKILIATDVSARGIDIPNVDFVINYDLPDIGETYVHRIGRTGRGRNKGIAYSFCSPEELPLLEAIEKTVTKNVQEVKLDGLTYNEVLNHSDPNKMTMADLAKMVDDIEEKKAGKKRKGKSK